MYYKIGYYNSMEKILYNVNIYYVDIQVHVISICMHDMYNNIPIYDNLHIN